MNSLQLTELLCEYHQNPLGIDVLHPRLSWQLQSNRRGTRQTGYQILVVGSEASLEQGRDLLWDSGKVLSDQSMHVPYAGKPLRSGQRAWWKVRVWDEQGLVSEYSASAWWEMGLLDRSEWQGRWIGGRLVGGPRTSVPCPFLRAGFSLNRPVLSARLYATALGLVEMHINGSRVGENVFTPGWTDYRKRVQYHVYDVKGMLVQGDNVLGAFLGDGWYCGFVAWRGRQLYGDRPRLLAQLMVTFKDGSQKLFSTGESWKIAYGPLLESDLLMGESYDARLEFPGWSKPGFDDTSWSPVECFPDPGMKIVAARGPAVRRIQEIRPVKNPVAFPRGSEQDWIFDLGQNMTGRVRLKVSGPAGTTVTIRHAEVLNPDGTLYTENLRSARATDHYTLRGEGEEVYEPHFTFHGFRYVELRGFPGKPDRQAVTGVVLHSDTPLAGSFECSSRLVNQLQHNILWGQKGNYLEVPTDCPQRDERLGWTGDAQVFIRTATLNMNVAAFFTKWMQDLVDSQSEAGAFPPVAPVIDTVNPDGGPAWADAGIICPWTIYLCYGDKSLLQEHYRSMVRYIDYLQNTSRAGIRCYPKAKGFAGHGDWVSIKSDTPKDLIGTAFFAYSASVMAKIARVLDKPDDVEKYAHLYQEVRRAFINRFVTGEGLVMGQTQTSYLLALNFDLLPDDLRSAVVDALVRDIKGRKMHLSTGFVGTPYLPFVLAQEGHLDIAYALLNQKSWPSWLYPVTKGATTIWERWDGYTDESGFQNPSMNSFNHYAFGSIGAWLYSVVAGIDVDPVKPGYKHILLHPRPGGGLKYAKAAFNSMFGEIVSDWRIKGRRFEWHILIPPNTVATVYVPATDTSEILEGERPAGSSEGVTFIRRDQDTAVYDVVSGRYHFMSDL